MKQIDARKIRLIRKADSIGRYRQGIGGSDRKGRHAPRPITLAPLPWAQAIDAPETPKEKTPNE